MTNPTEPQGDGLKADKVMTREEYAALRLKGWHCVRHDGADDTTEIIYGVPLAASPTAPDPFFAKNAKNSPEQEGGDVVDDDWSRAMSDIVASGGLPLDDNLALRDVFERPFDDDDPRLKVAQVITRREAEAILEHRGDLVAALTPKPSEDQRERVARIIDPDGWATRDRHYARIDALSDPRKDKDSLRKSADYYTQRSLAKADLILSTLPQERIAEGWRDAECMRLIHALRADEGDEVLILCDNPDFNGQPSNAVEVCGEWTRWGDKRFTGESLLDALSAAWIEKNRATGQPLPAPPASDGAA